MTRPVPPLTNPRGVNDDSREYLTEPTGGPGGTWRDTLRTVIVCAVIIAAAFLMATLSGCTPAATRTGSTASSTRLLFAGTDQHGTGGKAAALATLDRLPTRPRVKHPGYSRAQFGRAWTDATTAADGHNGCSTSDDVYAEQMTHVTATRRGRCSHVITAGTLADPYTGKTITYQRGQRPVRVDIDHVYPLDASWDMGAWQWPAAKRAAFANDTTHNLLAVDASSNRAKGSKTPAEWSPANRAGACLYATKYVTDAAYWGLPITPADKTSLTHTITEACR